MRNKVLCLLLMTAFAVFYGMQSSVAQEACAGVAETITKLKAPRMGSYSIRSFTDGDYTMDEMFTTGLPQPEWGTIMAGIVREKDGTNKKLLLARFDYRGRHIWRHIHEIEGLTDIIKIIPQEDHFIVLGDVKPAKSKERVFLGVFDGEGNLLREKLIIHDKTGLQARDIVFDEQRKRYTVAAQTTTNIKHPVFYTLSEKLNVLGRKAFMIGTENGIENMTLTPEGDVLAVGYAVNGYGRSDGWVMRLDRDHNMMWQRPYTRGRGAALQTVETLNARQAIVGGYADARDDTGRAAWVMVLETGTGNITWQRYYTDAHNVEVRDVLVHEGKRLSVLLSDQIKPDLLDSTTYIRLLTLNEQGLVLGYNDYLNGEGVEAAQMFSDTKGQRVMVGRTVMSEQIENAETQETQTMRSLNGWVVIGDRPGKFIDPCMM